MYLKLCVRNYFPDACVEDCQMMNIWRILEVVAYTGLLLLDKAWIRWWAADN
jgi:hypothetical protein